MNNDTEKNKKTARRFYEEVMKGGNLALIDELIADNYVEHEELPGIPPNKQGVKQWVQTFRSAFPDLEFKIENLIAEGDKVVIAGRVKGTHKGEFFGNKGTGRKLDLPMADIVRFQNGKAVEHWGYSDNAKMAEQLQLDFTGATAS